MSASNYLENKLLDHTLRVASFTQPAALYLSLHTADPGETGTSEATGGSYARQTIAFAAASAGVSASNTAQTFTMPAGTFTHFGIWDASTTGNFLFGGALTASKTTASGDQITFASGAVTVTAD